MGNLTSSKQHCNSSSLQNCPQWKRRLLSGLLISGVICLILGVGYRVMSSNQDQPGELAGVVLPKAKSIAEFSLVDHQGQPFDLARLQDKWTFMFFGYTHCPDVCPVSMAQLSEVFSVLQKKEPLVLKNSQVVFVSVDPQRDTQSVLMNYIPFFNKDFIGVTGETDAIDAFAKDLGVAYTASAPEKDGSYQVSHSSAFYLINPRGRLFARFQSSLHDVEKIVNYYLKIRGMAD